MIKLIFTLDYEIHGNGDGAPDKLIINPTYRLMKLLEKYNCKLTIFADVAEILKFKEYFEKRGNDKFNYCMITEQLRNAIKRGHDVQLHLHSSYFKSKYNGKTWIQYWPEYNLTGLSAEKLNHYIRKSKEYLEKLLRESTKDYSCFVFRAANWAMQPTPNIYDALIRNNIKIDSSIWKGAKQNGIVNIDYSDVFSNISAYNSSRENICFYDKNGLIKEMAIYSEQKYLWSFITPIRIIRIIRALIHHHKIPMHLNYQKNKKNDNRMNILVKLTKKYPWKLDYNQATGQQLINSLHKLRMKKDKDEEFIIVLSGHSKSYLKFNERSLEKYLKYIKECDDVKSIKYGEI